MLDYTKHIFSNGLRFIHHYDADTPMVAVNLLYNVGARDENEMQTGVAHLFEHLMFGGSKNAPSYDEPLQDASAENNAFTSNDLTNYYVLLPKDNIETALWLESDRMSHLTLNEKTLSIQKQVVIEEFKQRYLNQPYGDAWLIFRELCYKTHPYKWATIGKEIAHIESFSLEDAKRFYNNFYTPSNAILCIAGNIEFTACKELISNWFSAHQNGSKNSNSYLNEPEQTESRLLVVEKDVPADMIMIGYLGVSQKDTRYFAMDLLTDILGSSVSSRLYQNLVKNQQLFSDIACYHTDSIDKGLIVISGRISSNVEISIAEQAVMHTLQTIIDNGLGSNELTKVKNKKLTAIKFGEISILERAMQLCFAENIGNIDRVNEIERSYKNVSELEIISFAKEFLGNERKNTLYYKSNRK